MIGKTVCLLTLAIILWIPLSAIVGGIVLTFKRLQHSTNKKSFDTFTRVIWMPSGICFVAMIIFVIIAGAIENFKALLEVMLLGGGMLLFIFAWDKFKNWVINDSTK